MASPRFRRIAVVLVFTGLASIFSGMSSVLREELLERCGKLPPAQLREVLHFAEFLLSKPPARRATKRARGRSLRGFVGGVKHGALAQNIDHDLYGTVR